MSRPSHLVEYFLFSIFRGALFLLPFPAAQKAGGTLGRIFYSLMPGRRAITLDNLRHAFPEKTEAEREGIARGAFENFGISMCEFLSFGKLDRAELGRLLNYDANPGPFRRIASGGGLVFVTGHFGNWELAGIGSAALAGVSYLVIVRTQSNGLVDGVVNRIRCRFGNTVVPMDRAIKESLSALQGGRVVGLAADQSATRESDYVRFFGRDVATFRGPAAFALRAGVPMMIAFAARRPDGTYDFISEIVPSEDLHGGSEENVRELTRRHTEALERHIRARPDQWLWMHRRWKHVASDAGGEGGPGDAP